MRLLFFSPSTDLLDCDAKKQKSGVSSQAGETFVF
jgi:hypothetical protein